MSSPEAILRMADLRAMGYCANGVRLFCAKHGIEYIEFLRNGIPEERLLAIDDGMAKMAIERARNERR